MPHRADDNRYQHLPLILEQPNPDRRKRRAPPPPPPPRGGRSEFARDVRDQLNDMDEELARKPAPPAGLHPHLVFRVPLAGNVSPQQVAEMLEKIGITVVSIEADKAIIAFRGDADLSSFRQAVTDYEQGPRVNPKTGEFYGSTQWDVLEYIETPQMRLWGREDRIGRRLAGLFGDSAHSIVQDELYFVDVELWHQGTDELARGAIREVQQLIDSKPAANERVCDTFAGQLLCLARVAVRGTKLSQLLDLDVVAEAEIPPQPFFDHRQVKSVTEREFPTPPPAPPGGPTVCVVDSGVNSNHPLLSQNFGHAESILTETETTADENGHGTMVGGLAVFGNVRACYENGTFASPVTLYSARVLNFENRFDNETLIIHQMRRAIQVFTAAPYSCRVFNLSLGANAAWLQQNNRQSLWAESLDILAREYNILLVVSAGNHNLGLGFNPDDAEEVVTTYPEYLFSPECSLCEPATAAIPITVGGIADEATPAIPSASPDYSWLVKQKGPRLRISG